MSNGVIRVNFSSMDAAAGSIDQAAARMQAQLAELQGYTNRATAAWEGSARDAYSRLQADWDRTQDELTANLRRIATALRSSRERFHTLESRSTSLMG
jgi:6 kDa early secretory antigenic target